MDDLKLNFEIEKADPTGRFLRGWAYVHKDGSGQVVDYSGQQIEDIGVLREAAHDFMEHRIAKSMHGKDVLGNAGEPVGDIVESFIVDDDLAKALGMTTQKRGWFIGMRVHDTNIQKCVREGKLKQFSIGGKGRVEELKAAA